MLSTLLNVVKSGANLLQAAIPMGIKSLKYFIDSTFRDKVTPVAGSVLYCDLWLAVEHSGIYVGDGDISNIVVDGLAESEVKLSSPRSFTSKSTLGRKIYVSCDKYGAVGDDAVRHGANAHVGERAIYGLVIKNCHHFSTKCVNYAGQNDESFFSGLFSFSNVGETWEPSMHVLLFGASGEIREFSMDRQNNAAGLLAFLQQGFGGGTDFESPLKRAFEIIALQQDYKKPMC
jgi:hypothetical protein